MPTKEEILDANYKTGMHWKSVNRGNVLKAMEEFGKQKWNLAQDAQNKFREQFKGKQPAAVKTPYKTMIEPNKIPDDFEDDDRDEFIPCDKCDGHAACEDFGCAYELGLGNLVKNDENNKTIF